MTPHEIISLKLAELSAAIKAATPNMANLLREIHGALKADPDVVTLLEPEQVATIVAGLSKQTQTTIITSILKSGKGKALKSLAEDDV